MGALRGGTAVTANAHGGGAAGEHALNGKFLPFSDGIAEFFQKLIPAIIDGEQQFRGARDIHAAEYKTELRACKPSELRSSDARPARALRSQKSQIGAE